MQSTVTPGRTRLRRPRIRTLSPVRFRMLLLGVAVALAAISVLSGLRVASYGDLRTAVASGRVSSVEVYGVLNADATGSSTVQIAWSDAGQRRYTEVRQVRGDAQVSVTPSGDLSTVDPVADLTALDPGLNVTALDIPPVQSWSSLIPGWRGPAWLGVAGLALWLLVVMTAFQGPEPWWATRWAWFWLLFSPAAVVTVPAFILLSGPPPGVQASSHPGRRLTAPWAFALCLVLLPAIWPR